MTLLLRQIMILSYSGFKHDIVSSLHLSWFFRFLHSWWFDLDWPWTWKLGFNRVTYLLVVISSPGRLERSSILTLLRPTTEWTVGGPLVCECRPGVSTFYLHLLLSWRRLPTFLGFNLPYKSEAIGEPLTGAPILSSLQVRCSVIISQLHSESSFVSKSMAWNRVGETLCENLLQVMAVIHRLKSAAPLSECEIGL